MSSKAQREAGMTADYGTTPGQLGAMRDGSVESVVSSPPYAQKTLSKDNGIDWRKADQAAGRSVSGDYGASPGQLAQMPEGAAVPGQLEQAGENFWSAAREIVEQCHAALRPGGHAIWVVKAFVRKGKRVDFPGQWRDMCEAVGFRTLHEHRAWLVENHGTQGGLYGEDTKHTVARKSFFRRLAESKGSPRIDWETVWCMER